MGTKLSPVEASIYEALDRLLFREWDPFGVGDVPEAEDEYRSCLPGFWRLVSQEASDEAVMAYLEDAEVRLLEVGTSPERRKDVATKARKLVAAWRQPVRP